MREKTTSDIYMRTFPGAPRKGDLKRFEIISATIELLAQEGIGGLSFDQIGKLLKTRRSHITYYFKTKEDLLTGVLKYITASAQEITIQEVQAATSMRDRLRAIGTGALLWAEQFPDQAKVMLLFYFIFSYDPNFRRIHSEIRNGGWIRLQGVMQSLFADQPEMHARIPNLARALQSAITGLLIEKFTINDSQTVDYRQVLSNLCDQIIEAERD